MALRIPMVDLRVQNEPIKEEILEAIHRVMESQQFILGEEVERLEQEMASYMSTAHGVGVASGTDALWLALWGLGVERGDCVITSPFTFVATAEAISLLGAYPVFVDIDPNTFTLSPKRTWEYLDSKRAKVGDRIKGILAVHIFGNCCEIEGLLGVAGEFGLWLVEDVAQATGAFYTINDAKPRAAGTWGAAGCLSFYPTKNLGGIGDGGMIVTGDGLLAERLRQLRNHGSPRRYWHSEVGVNSRLDAIQAAVLRVKLRYLDTWNHMRVQRARRYNELFKESGLVDEGKIVPPTMIPEHNGAPPQAVFHQYVIRVPRGREELRSFLKGHGVETEVYYPVPLHLQPCYKSLSYREGDLPEAERACREALALPMYPQLPFGHQQYIVERICEFYRR